MQQGVAKNFGEKKDQTLIFAQERTFGKKFEDTEKPTTTVFSTSRVEWVLSGQGSQSKSSFTTKVLATWVKLRFYQLFRQKQP